MKNTDGKGRRGQRFRRPSRLRISLFALVGPALVLGTGAARADQIGVSSSRLTVFHFIGSSGAPVVRGWDGFNRADGALGSAVVGGIWGSRGGTWSVGSNTAKSTSAPASTSTLSLAAVLNCRIDLDLAIGADAYAGLNLGDDGTNNILVLYRKTPSVSEVQLIVWIGGSGPLPAPVAVAPVAMGSAAGITVTLSGSDISVLWNGVPTISYSLSAAESTAVRDANSIGYGMWAQSDATTRFDNFRVETS